MRKGFVAIVVSDDDGWGEAEAARNDLKSGFAENLRLDLIAGLNARRGSMRAINMIDMRTRSFMVL